MATNPIRKREEGRKPIDFRVRLPLKAVACMNYIRPHFLCLHKLKILPELLGNLLTRLFILSPYCFFSLKSHALFNHNKKTCVYGAVCYPCCTCPSRLMIGIHSLRFFPPSFSLSVFYNCSLYGI